MQEQIVVEGTVENIIYNNPDNGYTVFSVNIAGNSKQDKKDDNNEIICVGYVPAIIQGENIKISGTTVIHPAYGRQLQIETYEKYIPNSEHGIIKYLSSGLIRGIGKKTAEKIVEIFGTDTLRIMEDEPERLTEIRGISPKKAVAIGEIFHEQFELRNTVLQLQDYGISSAHAVKIFKKYKDKAVHIVEKNPYALVDSIFGVGFKTADQIAQKVGIQLDSPHRIAAGIKYILNTAAADGHVYLPEDELCGKTSFLLDLPNEVIKNKISELIMQRQLCHEKTENGLNIFLSSYYYAESSVSKKLLELDAAFANSNEDFTDEITQIENEENISLDKKQSLAVTEAMNSGVIVITGGPGTGKTTIINTIIKLLEQRDFEVELAAPTGRAAKRMSEATGQNAQTIHRLLGVNYMAEDIRQQTFDKNEENPIESDVIIIDETSMVDIILMNSLLKAISVGTRLILVGDIDQLPSVGAGKVLKDIINSGCINVVRLTEVFRQARESAIIMNAHRINNGEYPVINEKKSDFFFIRRSKINDVAETIVDLAERRLPKYLDCSIEESKKHIQVLSPMRKSPLGIVNLNIILQQRLNPPSIEKDEKDFRGGVFRVGDKVMQIKNNYSMEWKVFNTAHTKLIDEGTGVFNGDEGIIISINDELEILTVEYDDTRIVKYDYSQLDELELSYAVTIHKAQGSEYKCIIMPVFNGPDMLMTRNLLYTAVTRAKSLAVLVGIPDTLYKMVDNSREINRYTWLEKRIQSLHEYMYDDIT